MKKKILILIVIIVLLVTIVISWKYFTSLDRYSKRFVEISDPNEIAMYIN